KIRESIEEKAEDINPEQEINEIEEVADELPAEGYLDVQFICQAPLQTEENWKLHEESCEEAALLMAYLYESGASMSKEEANQEILQMIDWQKENFGGHHDIYADKVKELA